MMRYLAATVCAAALLLAAPVAASAAAPTAVAAPAAAVVVPAVGPGPLVEQPLEGFFPTVGLCNAERLSFRSQGYWTGGCFYSSTNRGWAFYYSR